MLRALTMAPAPLDPSGNVNVDLQAVGGNPITLGQNTSSNSIPVVLASDENIPFIAAAGNSGTGLLSNISDTVTVVNNGMSHATFSIAGVYTNAVIAFERSLDGGTTYLPFLCTRSDTYLSGTDSDPISSLSLAFEGFCSSAATNVRARLTAISTGSVTTKVFLTADQVYTAPTVGLDPTRNNIQGNVGSGISDSGNPVKTGGKYNSTQPTFTNGQRGDTQLTARGATIVAPGIDNFSVQATLTAETTKVIGTVNQGTNPWVISGSITPSGTQDVNITKYGSASTTLGQKTSANSMPVVIASDNNVNTISAQSARTSGSITTNTSVVSLSVTQYSSVTITLSGTYAGITVNFEVSDDGGTTWYSNQATLGSGFITYTAFTPQNNSLNILNSTVVGVTNFRVRANAYTSGTMTVGITATADPSVFSPTVGLSTTANSIQGSIATGAAKSGFPVQTGGVFNTTQPTVTTGQIVESQSTARGALIVATGVDSFSVDTELPAAAAAADGTTNPTAPFVQSANSIFNGTTWDRVKEAANALNSAGTGLPTAQIIGQFDDVSPTAITENQFGNIRMSANRNLYGTIRDAAGNERGANVNSNSALLTALDQTTVGTTNAVSIAQIGATTVATAGVNGTLAVGGNVATNVAIGTNPINLGAQGITSENSAVTALRMAQLVADKVGKLITLPYANPENAVKGNAIATNTTSTSCVASAGGSLKNYITNISVFNTGATTVEINIQDGSGGTTIYQCGAPAGGGAIYTFLVPVAGTAATAVFFAASGSTSTLYVSMAGYKGL